MFDVVALGELLIDFTPSGVSAAGNELFERNPGGAPANVLAALAKLGRKTAFIGKVGRDQFGEFLARTLDAAGVDIRGLLYSDTVNTTLAFVHLDRKGDRTFSFYRNPGADMTLTEGEVPLELIRNAKIFHFGSVSMTDEPSRTATLKAARYARDKGVFVSYDPNLRVPLWKDLTEAKAVISEGLALADLVKISEEELVFLTGTDNLEEGSERIREQYGIPLIFVTLGKKGCFYRLQDTTGYTPTYDVKTIDTTGAGDAFLGGMLHKILESDMKVSDLKTTDIMAFTEFGNATGSLATTKRGAIPAMPSLDEVEECMKKVQKL